MTDQSYAPDHTLMAGTDYECPVYINDSGRDGPVAFLIGGQHGIEPSGWMSTARFASAPIDRGTLIVIPYGNPLAIKQGRYSDTKMNGDMNGQWKPDREAGCNLAREIWAVADEWGPDVYIDNHSSSGIYGDGGVGQAIFPTRAGKDAAENTVQFLNEYCMGGYGNSHNWKMGNIQGDRSETTFIDRVGWLVAKPGFIVETTRAGTDLSERIEWQTIATGRLLRECGMIAGY